MKNTIKILTFAVVCTTASQSLGMSRLFSRLSKAGTRIAAHAKTQLTSARTKMAQPATMARFMATKPAARRILHGTAAGIAVASASGSVVGSRAQQKEWSPEQMQGKLNELKDVETATSQRAVSTADDSTQDIASLAGHFGPNESFHPGKKPQREWTPGEMQAKLNELRVYEDAATDKAVMTYDTLIEGTYVCKDDENKARLKLIQDNAKLLSQCLSRESTYRTQEEENNDQANQKKCADGYLALAKQAYNPQAGKGFRELAYDLMGTGFAKSMIAQPEEGDKLEASIDIQLKQAANNKDQVASFSYRTPGQVYRNRVMQFLYKPEFSALAGIDPTILNVRQTFHEGANGNADKQLMKFNFNMPCPLSDTLTITRIKMLMALKAAQTVKPSHQFVSTQNGFKIVLMDDSKYSESTSKKQ
jgi:hypothetical protein